MGQALQLAKHEGIPVASVRESIFSKASSRIRCTSRSTVITMSHTVYNFGPDVLPDLREETHKTP